MTKLTWKAVRCSKYCDGGFRGMDNCNTCGCTGSQLVHLPSKEYYPNDFQGWSKMKKEHPDVKDEDDIKK